MNEEAPTDDKSEENSNEDEESSADENKSEDEDKSEETPDEFVAATADDLTFEEGFEVDEELRDGFLEIVNDQEMSPKDRAQALVNKYQDVLKKASEASSESWVQMNKDWQGEVKADGDIGGEKLPEVLSGIGKLIDEYGSPELREVLDYTGAGNSIHMVKFLDTVAGKLTEGGHVSGQPPKSETTAAERMFPSMKG